MMFTMIEIYSHMHQNYARHVKFALIVDFEKCTHGMKCINVMQLNKGELIHPRYDVAGRSASKSITTTAAHFCQVRSMANGRARTAGFIASA
jgi:hypothetical protein